MLCKSDKPSIINNITHSEEHASSRPVLFYCNYCYICIQINTVLINIIINVENKILNINMHCTAVVLSAQG